MRRFSSLWTVASLRTHIPENCASLQSTQRRWISKKEAAEIEKEEGEFVGKRSAQHKAAAQLRKGIESGVSWVLREGEDKTPPSLHDHQVVITRHTIQCWDVLQEWIKEDEEQRAAQRQAKPQAKPTSPMSEEERQMYAEMERALEGGEDDDGEGVDPFRDPGSARVWAEHQTKEIMRKLTETEWRDFAMHGKLPKRFQYVAAADAELEDLQVLFGTTDTKKCTTTPTGDKHEQALDNLMRNQVLPTPYYSCIPLDSRCSFNELPFETKWDAWWALVRLMDLDYPNLEVFGDGAPDENMPEMPIRARKRINPFNVNDKLL
eukprot:TRINITY_DN67936_c10_g2_i1.p1 TRINITY_DN67936_c10_g2~~TRINITY_DN67936_c10_g2_i1.p1  ORF type:complete len:320 (+),score=52.48 TRINITY_DN67936_c10_g2_i1:79-1038(+)